MYVVKLLGSTCGVSLLHPWNVLQWRTAFIFKWGYDRGLKYSGRKHEYVTHCYSENQDWCSIQPGEVGVLMCRGISLVMERFKSFSHSIHARDRPIDLFHSKYSRFTWSCTFLSWTVTSYWTVACQQHNNNLKGEFLPWSNREYTDDGETVLGPRCEKSVGFFDQIISDYTLYAGCTKSVDLHKTYHWFKVVIAALDTVAWLKGHWPANWSEISPSSYGHTV